jgi:hypothetical protein
MRLAGWNAAAVLLLPSCLLYTGSRCGSDARQDRRRVRTRQKNSGCCVGDKQQLHDGSRYDDGTGYTSTCPALQHATFLQAGQARDMRGYCDSMSALQRECG